MIMPVKIREDYIKTGCMQTKEEKKNIVSIKTNPFDCFLNDSFVEDFFQQQYDHIPTLNLSGFKVSKCEIIPLKVKNSRAVIEFKLRLDSKKRIKIIVINQYTRLWQMEA